MGENRPQRADMEPADQYRLCVDAFNKLDIPVQLVVTNSLGKLLNTVMDATLKAGGELSAQPLGLMINMIRAVFQAPSRVVFLRRAECCITFHQPSALVNSLGEAQVDIEYRGPQKGHGEAARKMARTAMEMLKAAKREPIPLDGDLGQSLS